MKHSETKDLPLPICHLLILTFFYLSIEELIYEDSTPRVPKCTLVLRFFRFCLYLTIRHFEVHLGPSGHVIGCINHDIGRGLCSELLMRYPTKFIRNRVKSFLLTWGSNLGPTERELLNLPFDLAERQEKNEEKHNEA